MLFFIGFFKEILQDRLAAKNDVKQATIILAVELSRSYSLARALDFFHALSLPLPSHLFSFFPAP